MKVCLLDGSCPGLIETNVKKRFGDFVLDASLSDEKFICITGKNGSGKTTLLKIIAGFLEPDQGEVKLNSKPITKLPPEKRSVVLVTPDSYIPHLSVETHLRWGAKVKGLSLDKEHVNKVRKDLGVAYDGKLAALSLGMRERVALATALLSHPALILVDEAFSNIDSHSDFVSSFRELSNTQGTDTIFTTQLVEDPSLSDHHYNLEFGKISKIF